MFLFSLDDNNIESKMELSKKQYIEINKCRELLFNYESSQFLISMIALNQKELEDYLSNSLSRYIELNKNGGFSYVFLNQIRFNANRYLMHYLGSMRTFLDHMETKISKQYGKKSKEFKKFKDMTHDAYDNMKEYRILYSLRNYAQHCGLPIGNVELNNTVQNDTPKYRLIVSIDTEELLSKDYKWKEVIKQDLQNSPKKIIVNEILGDLTEKLKEINLEVFKFRYPSRPLQNSANKISYLIKDIINNDNYPVIGDIELKDKEKEEYSIEMKHFPLRALQHLGVVKMNNNKLRIE